MPAHLPAPDYGGMDPASARYLIRINGHLGVTLLAAFPALAWKRQGPETVLTGMLDRPALPGVLGEMEALAPEPGRPPSQAQAPAPRPRAPPPPPRGKRRAPFSAPPPPGGGPGPSWESG